MPFLNLDTFSAIFIVSGMAFQRILPRKAREFMPKDIILVVGSCSVFLIHRSYVSSLPGDILFAHMSLHGSGPALSGEIKS